MFQGSEESHAPDSAIVTNAAIVPASASMVTSSQPQPLK